MRWKIWNDGNTRCKSHLFLQPHYSTFSVKSYVASHKKKLRNLELNNHALIAGIKSENSSILVDAVKGYINGYVNAEREKRY